MNLSELENICIVGPGLMGGSLGLALQATGYKGGIIALERDPSDLEAAINSGAVFSGATSIEELPDRIDLFCLAVPLSAMCGVLRQLAPRLDDPSVIVTDVGSVKVPVIDAASSVMKYPGNFVGGHPMTGFRHQGVTYARADLYQGATVILTPISATNPQALHDVRSMWEAIGARVTTMLPARHDEVVGRVSHLPHAVVATLLLLAARDEGLDVAATGLLDVTRIASRDTDLWLDTLVTNRDQVRRAIDQFIADLQRLDTWLERHEDGNIQRLLVRAAQIRQEWVTRKFDHPKWID
ncbi:MAG: prephenate dehydrogenase/arogenate dehydrogenase family protein [Planctomycetota bacterium]